MFDGESGVLGAILLALKVVAGLYATWFTLIFAGLMYKNMCKTRPALKVFREKGAYIKKGAESILGSTRDFLPKYLEHTL